MIVMMKADGRTFPAPPPRGNAPVPDSSAPADVQLALRLKVVNRQITEAEHIIARISAPSQLAALKTPRDAFAKTVSKAERNPRNILLLIANSYYDALTQNNGELAPLPTIAAAVKTACIPRASVARLTRLLRPPVS